MKIAIFSDVHGNLTGLKTVLAHIEERSPDAVVFAGDLCLFGPRPADCLAELRRRDIATIYGNTDEWIDSPPAMPDDADEEERRWRQPLIDICQWTRNQLDQDGIDWLNTLPFEHRISPTGDSQDDLLVVHANPVDVHQVIYPSESRQKELFGNVHQEQTEEDLAPLLEGVNAGALAFGHLHIPNEHHWRNLRLANISSVSLAGDGDIRAKYGILTWTKSEGWSVQIQRVPYDMEQELKAMAWVEPPNWQSYADRLKKAGM